MIGKILGMMTIGRSLVSVGLLRRFLRIFTNLLILAIVSAFMLCILLASFLYAIYLGLIQYGIAPHLAGAMMIMVVVMATVVLVALSLFQLRQLRDLSQGSLSPSKSHIPDIGCIAEAFIDGFLHSKK